MAKNADNSTSNCRDAYGASNGKNASQNKTSNVSGQNSAGRNAQDAAGTNSTGENASKNKASNASGQNKSGSNCY